MSYKGFRAPHAADRWPEDLLMWIALCRTGRRKASWVWSPCFQSGAWLVAVYILPSLSACCVTSRQHFPLPRPHTVCSVYSLLTDRVFDFRLYFFFASKRNEANRDPFRMHFSCSLRSFRFLFFAIFAYFHIKSFFVFAFFRFLNFLLNINCWIWVFSYIICSM